MCRHLAYLGPPATLHDLLYAPPHSLAEQAYAPREQQHGTINVDGYGAGWYLPGRAEPVRFRRGQPLWTDASFASLAPTVASRCVLAAVRSATVGYPSEESGAAPFTYDRWLFSHNGAVADPALMRKTLLDRVSWVPDALAGVDAAFLFGLAVTRWTAGAGLGAALADVVADMAAAGGGRLTLLATDGAAIAGVTAGEPMYVRRRGSGADASVLVASERSDDGPGWERLPAGSLVEATAREVSVTAL